MTIKRYSHGPYVMLHIDGRRILEHRHVMQQFLGRELRTDECVHHKNENKRDNRLSNLEVMTISEHMKHHGQRPEAHVEVTCAFCSKKFDRLISRIAVNVERKHINYCSKRCVGLSVQYPSGIPENYEEHGTMRMYPLCGPPRCSACKKARSLYEKQRGKRA